MEGKYSPEEQHLRDLAAQQIKSQREMERDERSTIGLDYTHGRGILEYTAGLQGITHFLSYIRSLSFGKGKLLDIGSGQGRGITELAQADDLTYNLEIIGTSLSRNDKAGQYEQSNNIRLLSAETLKGIGDGEISGIISVHGVGHSKAPELVAKSIHRVLMPSGAFKTTYVDMVNTELEQNASFNEQHERLEKALKDLGMDVEIFSSPSHTFGGEPAYHRVLTAIKPPVVGITAKKLMAMDFGDYQNQMEDLAKKGFNIDKSQKHDPEDDEDTHDLIEQIVKRFES